jgi:dihydroorotase (multifunctional complex type)
MATIRIPGLIDAHVHLREPGYVHKEGFATGTAAALAGGVTAVLDMPNTFPPTATPEAFEEKARLATSAARCDVGLFVGATTSDLDAYLPAANRACGLKIYVSDTFGSLRIDRLEEMHRFFRTWAEAGASLGYRSEGAAQGIGPIAVHAEDMMLPVCLNLCHLYDVPLHIVHVTRRSEIELIALAKDRGYRVTCEVTPHHLLLTSEDAERLGSLGDMRPKLASPDDVAALWEYLPVIDIFATDHAPHTLEEKNHGTLSPTTPPGVPGVETMLPLLLTEVHSGRMNLYEVLERCHHAPRRIYGIPEQEDTYVEVDTDQRQTIRNDRMLTKVGWTPFHGREVVGKVERVVLRGQTVYDGERILAQPGFGKLLFASGSQPIAASGEEAE